VIEIGCWAHARRRFVEAFMLDTAAALMIALIQQLYQVEHAAADLDPEARRALRRSNPSPSSRRSPPSDTPLLRPCCRNRRSAMLSRYLTNRWAALQRFAEDGRLAIDNNRAENQLRLVAVGRKNWLFAGSFEGARRAALLYSLVQSSKLIGIPPFDYLKDVLLRVATHPHQLIAQLTPRAWAETFRRNATA
jgi:transposase